MFIFTIIKWNTTVKNRFIWTLSFEQILSSLLSWWCIQCHTLCIVYRCTVLSWFFTFLHILVCDCFIWLCNSLFIKGAAIIQDYVFECLFSYSRPLFWFRLISGAFSIACFSYAADHILVFVCFDEVWNLAKSNSVTLHRAICL